MQRAIVRTAGYAILSIGITVFAWDQVSNDRLHVRTCRPIHHGTYSSLETPQGFLHWVHRNVRHYTGTKPKGLAISYRYGSDAFSDVPQKEIKYLENIGYIARMKKTKNDYVTDPKGDQFVAGTAEVFGKKPLEKIITWNGTKQPIKCLKKGELAKHGLSEKERRIYRSGSIAKFFG